MPAPLISRDEVLDRLTAVFRRDGFDGASLKRLSEATGLGKASLYHYFPGGKEDMARAVLQAAHARFGDVVLAPLKGPGPARSRLRRMADGLMLFYGGGRQSCLLDLFGIGDAQALFGDGLKQGFWALLDALADVLIAEGVAADQARERAEDAVIAVQGAIVLSRGLDDAGPFVRTVRRLPDRLLG